MKVLEQKMIHSAQDIMNLNIVDWNRLNGSWQGVGDAVETITSWFIDKAIYTIVERDLSLAPQRNDWPGWDHVGHHESLGRLYWNDFYYHYKGVLTFSDAPDFYGELIGKAGSISRFWGDIGQVSAQTFAVTQKKMEAHDLWISVLDSQRQVLIESMVDIHALYISEIMGDETDVEEVIREAENCPRCRVSI